MDKQTSNSDSKNNIEVYEMNGQRMYSLPNIMKPYIVNGSVVASYYPDSTTTQRVYTFGGDYPIVNQYPGTNRKF